MVVPVKVEASITVTEVPLYTKCHTFVYPAY